MESQAIDILRCKAGARLCALRLEDVVETMRVLPMEAVEGSLPSSLAGLSLIRGQPCPVLDLALLLGETQRPERLVLLRVPSPGQADRRVALAVSSVEGVSRTSREVLSELPPLLSAAEVELVESIAVHDAQLITILNTGSLLSEQDWAILEAS